MLCTLANRKLAVPLLWLAGIAAPEDDPAVLMGLMEAEVEKAMHLLADSFQKLSKRTDECTL